MIWGNRSPGSHLLTISSENLSRPARTKEPPRLGVLEGPQMGPENESVTGARGNHLAIALQRPDASIIGRELCSNFMSAVQLAPPGKPLSLEALWCSLATWRLRPPRHSCSAPRAQSAAATGPARRPRRSPRRQQHPHPRASRSLCPTLGMRVRIDLSQRRRSDAVLGFAPGRDARILADRLATTSEGRRPGARTGLDCCALSDTELSWSMSSEEAIARSANALQNFVSMRR